VPQRHRVFPWAEAEVAAGDQNVYEVVFQPLRQIQTNRPAISDGVRHANSDQDRPSSPDADVLRHPADAPDQVGHHVPLALADGPVPRVALEENWVPEEIQLNAVNVVGLAYFLDCPESLLAGWRLGEVNS
jgi:hypothetical protein